MFDRQADVNGETTQPIYKILKKEAGVQDIDWYVRSMPRVASQRQKLNGVRCSSPCPPRSRFSYVVPAITVCRRPHRNFSKFLVKDGKVKWFSARTEPVSG
jgi:glutathione peroxidase-family protein